MPEHPTGYCERCGALAPVKRVTFMQNIGVIILRFHKQVSGNLCRTCIDQTFWPMTLITLFFGWWGIISFFFTLVALPVNLVSYLGALSLPKPEAGAGRLEG